MKPHQTFLELAAIAIDYPLTSSERRHLDEHLAGCKDCVRSASALRGDAVAIGSLPPLTLSDRRGDLILAAALRPAAANRPLRLVAIAALLALLITGSIAVGALLLQRIDKDLAVIVPVPTASPTASPDAGPTSSPSAGPTPSASSTPIAVPPFGTLAVTGEADLQSWVEVVAPDGTVTRMAGGSNAAWLGADRIVYECSQPGPTPIAVCSVDVATPGAVRVIADGLNPAPAPDGRSIAIHRGEFDVGSTWIVEPDGSNLRELAPGRLSQWSPDGAWLAGQTDSATFEVSIIRADGTGLRTLAPGFGPAWSPSGDRIVYLFSDDNGATSLRVVDVATGAVSVLYAPKGVALSAPAWLGDRGWAFVQDGNIWRLDVGASDPVQLTTDLAIETASANVDPLSVSADNEWVAFTTGIDTTSRVGVVSVNGGLDVIYPGEAGMSDPAWAPGGAGPGVPAASAPAPQAEGDLGFAWTDATIPAVPDRPEGLVEAVTAGGPGFVAVGRGCITNGDKDTCEVIVWTSTDGRAWERAPASDATDTRPAFSTSGPELGMFDVAAGEPGLVAIGYAARPDMQATIWFSPDGSSWERIPLGLAGSGTDPGDFLATRVNAVTWDGRSFVAVGEDRSDYNGSNLAKAKAQAAVWTSPDGRTWIRDPHTPAFDVGGFVDTGEDPSSGGIHDVVAGPDGLVAIGTVCSNKPAGCGPAAWTSTDEASWERAVMPSVPGWPTALAATDTGYVAVGGALVLTSPDGRVWTQQPLDPERDFRAVTTIDNRLYATSPGPTTLWTSDDGSEWVPAAHDGGPATGSGGPSDWRFAATPDTAVWLGRDGESDAPVAWVSVPVTAP